MRYLLDTNVLSEGRRKQPEPGVIGWLERTSETNLYLSVLVLGEVRKGIAKLSDEAKQAALFTWLEAELMPRFGERVLGVDAETALVWGRLSGDSERRGEPLPIVDTLLAATALRHNLTLVTRNARDFRRYPVEVFDPWNAGES